MRRGMSLYEKLQYRLVNGFYSAGQRLKTTALAEAYETSASTMRETLFRLSTVGLVEFEEQRGFRMPQISTKTQRELTLMRILLESEGACRSIENGGVAWGARLTAAHHKLSHIEGLVRAGQRDSEILVIWTDAELEFHRTLIDACGLDLLMDTHLIVYNRFRQQMINSDQNFTYVPENITQHKRIVEAALAGDPQLTRARISEHLIRNADGVRTAEVSAPSP
jgi:DNA-binding GntR family transcriptional regulator